MQAIDLFYLAFVVSTLRLAARGTGLVLSRCGVGSPGEYLARRKLQIETVRAETVIQPTMSDEEVEAVVEWTESAAALLADPEADVLSKEPEDARHAVGADGFRV